MALKTRLAVSLLLASASLAAQADPLQWSVNGHYYEYNPEPVTWEVAFSIANSSEFNGMQGYLATVTSAAENTFVANVASGNVAWLGGSDDGAAVNSWTWRNGPEAGQAFTYTNWNPSEPNDCCGGENYLQVNFAVFAGWNDHGGPGNPLQQNGFVIEYGVNPVPEPGAAALLLAGLGLLGLRARRRA